MWKFAKSFSLRLVNRPLKRLQLLRNWQRYAEKRTRIVISSNMCWTRKKVENSLHLTYISKRQFGKRENLQMFKKEEKKTMIFFSSFLFFLFQLQPSSLRLLCFFPKNETPGSWLVVRRFQPLSSLPPNRLWASSVCSVGLGPTYFPIRVFFSLKSK